MSHQQQPTIISVSYLIIQNSDTFVDIIHSEISLVGGEKKPPVSGASDTFHPFSPTLRLATNATFQIAPNPEMVGSNVGELLQPIIIFFNSSREAQNICQ